MMNRSGVALVVVAVGAALTVGCASDESLIRSDFARSTSCPASQILVAGNPGGDYPYRATGCGYSLQYECEDVPYTRTNGHSYPARSCGARQLLEYEATDGTSHSAWFDEETHANDAMSVEAVLASAAHDLPCDRASLKVLGTDAHGFGNVVEGCGQRVTYQISDVGEQPAPGLRGPVRKHKYIVVGRMPLSTPASPAPAASAPSH
ncbi:MAG TPA: hypothetical protein VIY73_28325 [Polyangiaceae bacterium]